jgi:RNA polymerase sigma-70 factor (ECF subfamily)
MARLRSRTFRRGERNAQAADPATAGTEAEGAVVGMGDPSVPTWEEVATVHGHFIFTVAYRLTGNRSDAEDLAQDVLLRVKRGLETYRPGSIEGWLSRITMNVFLDEMRRRRRRPIDALPDDPERVLPASPGVDEVIDSSSMEADLERALARLPEEFRTAVVLCDVAGLPYAEISETLGVPIGTVRSRIHRGRLMLRDALVGVA